MGINRYYGGKYKYAKKIANAIERYASRHETYIEPFCGWCSVLSEVVDRKLFEKHIASDANESIVMFLHDTSRGDFVPPGFVSEDEYNDLKSQKSPSALQAFAGVCYSFNGTWFNGYGPRSDPEHHYKNSERFSPILCSYFGKLKDVQFGHEMYEEYVDHEGCFFYLDPPYKSRGKKYKFSDGTTIPFDTDEFWEFARKLSATNTVMVSEYEAPEDFECVLEFKGRNGSEKVFKILS
jgi:DNA adenine methylase